MLSQEQNGGDDIHTRNHRGLVHQKKNDRGTKERRNEENERNLAKFGEDDRFTEGIRGYKRVLRFIRAIR